MGSARRCTQCGGYAYCTVLTGEDCVEDGKGAEILLIVLCDRCLSKLRVATLEEDYPDAVQG